MSFRAISVRSKAFDHLLDVFWTFCPCLRVSLTCGTHSKKKEKEKTLSLTNKRKTSFSSLYLTCTWTPPKIIKIKNSLYLSLRWTWRARLGRCPSPVRGGRLRMAEDDNAWTWPSLVRGKRLHIAADGDAVDVSIVGGGRQSTDSR